jgi:hypothetical protein
MRKILLASSALVGVAMLAAPAFAGDLTVKLSGNDTAMLGFNTTTGTTDSEIADNKSNSVGMENLFDINVSVEGKGSNNLDYGAFISIWDGPSVQNGWASNTFGGAAGGTANAAYSNDAYVWMSNNWGKVMFGDAHGASDLFVYAPTVGTNQIDGYFQQFQDLNRDWRALPTFIDNNESSTRITYYTPKIAGFQGGISWTPNLYSQGLTNNSTIGGTAGTAPTYGNMYDNQVEAAIGWSGSYDKANIKITGLATEAQANEDIAAVGLPLATNYLSLGLGAQVNFAGFTVGGSYSNGGHYDAVKFEDKPQDMWTLGAKYDMDKASFAINGELGEGYDMTWGGSANLGVAKTGDAGGNPDYIRQYDALGFGATYTWFPGLVSGVDVVFFNQDGEYSNEGDSGVVAILSQRVNF